MRLMSCPYCGHEAMSGGIGALYCGPHVSTEGDDAERIAARTPAILMREKGTMVWEHVEFGHRFQVFALAKPDAKGRGFRLYDNGHPALGGQWHYTLENAQERAEYVTKGSYSQRIGYLEQRVQVLEAQIARAS